MPLLGANGGLIGAARTSRRGAAVGLWTPNEQVIYQRQNAWIGDASFDSVSLLLHMNGSNGSTTFTDSSSNALTVTANGNAQISTAQSKFGGASGYFDGSGDYLLINSTSLLTFNTGDFTVECWVYSAAATGGGANADKLILGGFQNTPDMLFFLDNSSLLPSLYDGTNQYSASTGIPANTWTHVCWCRSSGVLRTFINGAVGGSWSMTTNFSSTNTQYIGGDASTGNRYFNGYIDDLRITKGVARYTANFTAPTAPFPDL